MDDDTPVLPPADFSALPGSSVGAEPDAPPTDERGDALPRWALVYAGQVFTVVQQETEPALPGYVAVPVLAGDVVSPGDGYANGEGFSPAAAAPAPRHITTLACKMRFTRAERIGIRAAAAASPEVADFLDMLNSARYVDLDRPDTRESVQALEAGRLLASGRALEILDSPVMPGELAGGLA